MIYKINKNGFKDPKKDSDLPYNVNHLFKKSAVLL